METIVNVLDGLSFSHPTLVPWGVFGIGVALGAIFVWAWFRDQNAHNRNVIQDLRAELSDGKMHD
jgi:hypothetical protein